MDFAAFHPLPSLSGRQAVAAARKIQQFLRFGVVAILFHSLSYSSRLSLTQDPNALVTSK